MNKVALLAVDPALVFYFSYVAYFFSESQILRPGSYILAYRS